MAVRPCLSGNMSRLKMNMPCGNMQSTEGRMLERHHGLPAYEDQNVIRDNLPSNPFSDLSLSTLANTSMDASHRSHNQHTGNLNITNGSSYHVGNNLTLGSSLVERKNKILWKLSEDQLYNEVIDAISDPDPGTCQWVLSHERFASWMRDKDASVLWISARPGNGKSVLAKHLVTEVLASAQRTVLFYFFKGGFDANGVDANDPSATAARTMRGLLHQLLKARPDLFTEDLLNHLESTAFVQSSVNELWKVLIQTSEDTRVGEIVCVLDAYDECDRAARAMITSRLESYMGPRSSRIKLKLLITSRANSDIREGFKNLPIKHIDGEREAEGSKISLEITNSLDCKLAELCPQLGLSQEGAQLVRRRLIQGDDRTYIWMVLMLDFIQREYRERAWREPNSWLTVTLRDLPPKTFDAYEALLAKIPAGEQRAIRRLLHIVLAAARPLTVREVSIAMRLQSNTKSLADLSLRPDEEMAHWIKETSGSFVTVVGSEVHLIHQTARDFLARIDLSQSDLEYWLLHDPQLGPREVRHTPEEQYAVLHAKAANLLEGSHNDGMDIVAGVKWRGSFLVGISHSLLAMIAMWYLELPECRSWDDERRREVKFSSFFDYCARFWYSHCFGSQYFPLAQLMSLCGSQQRNGKICPTEPLPWFEFYPYELTGRWRGTPIYVASVRIIKPVCLEFLSQFDAAIEGSRTPDWISFNRKKRLEEQNENKRRACKLRHDFNWLDREGRNALSWSVALRGKGGLGRLQVLEMYLERKDHLRLEIDYPDNIGLTPLAMAVLTDNVEPVELLLKHGAHPGESHGHAAIAPWIIAVEQNNPRILQLFSSYMPSVGSTGFTDAKILELGRSLVIPMILRSFFDKVKAIVTITGWKALADLTMCWRDVVFHAQWKRNVECREPYEERPLIQCPWSGARQFTLMEVVAMYGSETMMTECIDCGLDVGFKTPEGLSLLHLAAWRRNFLTIKVLVSYIDINTPALDATKRTPLEMCSLSLIIKILLDHGAALGFCYLSTKQLSRVSEVLQRYLYQNNDWMLNFLQIVITWLLMAEEHAILREICSKDSCVSLNTGWKLDDDIRLDRLEAIPTGSLMQMVALSNATGGTYDKAVRCLDFLVELGVDVNAEDTRGFRLLDPEYTSRIRLSRIDLPPGIPEAPQWYCEILRKHGGVSSEEARQAANKLSLENNASRTRTPLTDVSNGICYNCFREGCLSQSGPSGRCTGNPMPERKLAVGHGWKLTRDL